MAHLYERKHATYHGSTIGTQPDDEGRSYVLVLDEYEAANLKWLLDHAMHNSQEDRISLLDTGDWCGQIKHALDDATIGVDPNGRERLDPPK